jgi:hypothetical protein
MDAMFQPRSLGATLQFSLAQRQTISDNMMANMLDKLRASIPQNIDSFFDYIASARTDTDTYSLFGRLICQLAFNHFAHALFANSSERFSTQLFRF